MPLGYVALEDIDALRNRLCRVYERRRQKKYALASDRPGVTALEEEAVIKGIQEACGECFALPRYKHASERVPLCNHQGLAIFCPYLHGGQCFYRDTCAHKTEVK